MDREIRQSIMNAIREFAVDARKMPAEQAAHYAAAARDLALAFALLDRPAR